MPTERRVFYGWWIAVTAALGFALGAPSIFVFAFPVFLKAIAGEFHTSRAAIALAFSLHNIVAASAAPFAGRLIDRVGVRRVIIPGTLLCAFLLLANRVVARSLSGVYAFYIVGGLVGLASGPIVYSTLVSRWFDRRRGSALAVMMLGPGIAGVFMPSVMQRLISMTGWHTAYAVFGAAMLVLSLPIVTAMLKERPADLGLVPDGDRSASWSAAASQRGTTWPEARRTSTFWLMTSAVGLLGASVHACILHLAAMLSDQGLTAQTAALASSIAGSGLLVGRIGTGFLLDRWLAPRVASGVSFGAALGIALLLASHGFLAIALGAFLVGLGMGSEGDLIAYLTSRYFGFRSFSEIYGFTFGSFMLAGAGGAWLMGYGFDRAGSYAIPLIGFEAAAVVASALFWRLGPYRFAARTQEELTVEPVAATV